MMRFLFSSKQKKTTTKVSGKDTSKKAVSLPRVFKSDIKRHTKNSLKKTVTVTKKGPSLGKKMMRHTKQGVKSMLLSPSFHTTFKVMVGILLSSGLMYSTYLFIGKTFANEVVVSQSEIIARVAKLTPLPQEDPYEIVRVQDGEDLKKQNPFYKDIKEGDYILMYKDMAVIYDLRADTIVSVKMLGEK